MKKKKSKKKLARADQIKQSSSYFGVY